jgi:pimeloyl-ACP methyl ester carboxylesterase
MVPHVHGETYARLLPNAQLLKIIDQAGHSVHIEQPEATAKTVLDFLES